MQFALKRMSVFACMPFLSKLCANTHIEKKKKNATHRKRQNKFVKQQNKSKNKLWQNRESIHIYIHIRIWVAIGAL